MQKLPFILFLFTLIGLLSFGVLQPNENAYSKIKLPKNFSISTYADNVKNARSMVRGEEGIMFVGTRSAGNVYALIDTNKDFKSDITVTLASGLNMPNGVDLKDGNLYVAEIDKILVFKDIYNNLKEDAPFETVFDKLPNKVHHGWKFIKFGPDGKLYIPVGAPCNICLKDEVFASIHRLDLETKELELVASGVRNSVGFDWSKDGVLYFSDNGRDNLGNDIPPDELNRVSYDKEHFGYPYCHGGDIQDPKFDKEPCSKFTAPVQNLGPHVASLGIEFGYDGNLPNHLKQGVFIAEHGSWNRDEPIGYRITYVDLDAKGNSRAYKIFAQGWLQEDGPTGRPVDIEWLWDGSMAVSDDFAGKIYRIQWKQ